MCIKGGLDVPPHNHHVSEAEWQPDKCLLSKAKLNGEVRKMFRSSTFGRTAAVVALVAAGSLTLSGFAEAKVGSGSSAGSRGSRTFSAPPTTNTAPKQAAPVERSITQPGQAQATRPGQSGPTAAAATTARPSMFGGFRGLLLGGLFAGALASIFGVGALASVFGFVLQAALLGGVVFLIYNFIRNRRNGAPAMATATSSPGSAARPDVNAYRASAASTATGALAIGPDDFNAFERLLTEVQLAYGSSDLKALGDRMTPEMLSYLAADLEANRQKGIRNEISDPKLLQGDLAEAWREGNSEYATVAMRFSLVDRMVDIASGRVVSGGNGAPSESTEVWTFRRPPNGSVRQWELSAIQQA